VNLWTFLNRAESLWPKHEAIVDGKRRLTYADVATRVRRLATQLARLGLKQGEVVSIIAPNCVEFIEAYFASAMLGSILNPINHRLSPKEIASILRDCGAKTLMIHASKSSEVYELIARAGVLEQIIFIGGIPDRRPSVIAFDYDSLLEPKDHFTMEPAYTTANDVAQIYYTSGTAGKPKGVMLTHTNVLVHALAAISELQLNEKDVWLHAAPMFHLADAWAVFAITSVGGRHVILPTFEVSAALDLLEWEGVTITNLIPTMLNSLLHDADAAKRKYKNLRRIMTGGAAIAPHMVRQLLDTFRCDYLQTYGMTEASPYLTLSLQTADEDRMTAEQRFANRCRTGRPFLSVELKVVRSDGSTVESDDKEVGEVIVRGPTITPGYWRSADATQEAFKNGWLYTGDLATINNAGSINIVDRNKDVIICGGETIYSIEVENVLHEHPSVLEAAVIGSPDHHWGEVVNAVVVLRDGHFVKESELIEFVKGNIAHFKAPQKVAFTTSLPKLGNGKIWKNAIKDFKDWQFGDGTAETVQSQSDLVDPSEDGLAIPVDIEGTTIAEWVKLVNAKESSTELEGAVEGTGQGTTRTARAIENVFAKDMAEDMAKDMAEVIGTDVEEAIKNDTAEDTTKNVTKEIARGAAEDVVKDVAKDLTRTSKKEDAKKNDAKDESRKALSLEKEVTEDNAHTDVDPKRA
jgi:acyl-CoA synthetase (AMP-forming)/AMP-acid ligase II